MGKTNIEFCDQVSNPLYAVNVETGKIGTFCEKPDPNGTCKNCWAEALNKRLGNGLEFDKANPKQARGVWAYKNHKGGDINEFPDDLRIRQLPDLGFNAENAKDAEI